MTILLSALLALSTLAQAEPLTEEQLAGQATYTANCMACHGTDGDGQGPAAIALNPAPKSFTEPTFWEGKDNDALKTTIKAGKPGTAMSGFTQLSDSDVANLIAYLETFKPPS